jgi:hypothetical protein
MYGPWEAAGDMAMMWGAIILETWAVLEVMYGDNCTYNGHGASCGW